MGQTNTHSTTPPRDWRLFDGVFCNLHVYFSVQNIISNNHWSKIPINCSSRYLKLKIAPNNWTNSKIHFWWFQWIDSNKNKNQIVQAIFSDLVWSCVSALKKGNYLQNLCHSIVYRFPVFGFKKNHHIWLSWIETSITINSMKAYFFHKSIIFIFLINHFLSIENGIPRFY